MAAESGTVTPSGSDRAALVLQERIGWLGVELDRRTGLPTALLASNGARRHPLRVAATLLIEGDEVDRDPFGLAYANTRDLSDFRLNSPDIAREFAGDEETFVVATAVEGWQVWWEYRFRARSPRLEIQIVL